MALNLDGWVLLYLGCCLLYMICVTGHYGFCWFGPTMLLEWGVIPLFVVLPVLSQCIQLVIVVATELGLKLLKWAVFTLFTVLLVLHACVCYNWMYQSLLSHLVLLYGCYDQFAWFSSCLLPKIEYFIVNNGGIIDDGTVLVENCKNLVGLDSQGKPRVSIY